MTTVPISPELLASIERCVGFTRREIASVSCDPRAHDDTMAGKIIRSVIEEAHQDCDRLDGWLRRAKEARK